MTKRKYDNECHGSLQTICTRPTQWQRYILPGIPSTGLAAAPFRTCLSVSKLFRHSALVGRFSSARNKGLMTYLISAMALDSLAFAPFLHNAMFLIILFNTFDFGHVVDRLPVEFGDEVECSQGESANDLHFEHRKPLADTWMNSASALASKAWLVHRM